MEVQNTHLGAGIAESKDCLKLIEVVNGCDVDLHELVSLVLRLLFLVN